MTESSPHPSSGSGLSKGYYRAAAVVLFLGVSLGAIGAHALKDILAETGRADNYHTAVLYHLIHGLALMLIAQRAVFRIGAWWCLFAGILLFSGSLYALSLTGNTSLAAITPFGGLAFLAGWAWLAIRA